MLQCVAAVWMDTITFWTNEAVVYVAVIVFLAWSVDGLWTHMFSSDGDRPFCISAYRWLRARQCIGSWRSARFSWVQPTCKKLP